ncbi:MAG: type II toxin-antitoxin system RelE/ParE family toxin [Actinomycetota bacterium]|nr:type II toxin-antitoxin system RelE/ParE family toxin [Actinomycetota bacterium]
MIKSFANKDTERVFSGRKPKKLPQQILDRAEAKLVILDSVAEVEELRTPPGNRLEQLGGDRAGQWSVRINQQYRICFNWENGDAYDVEIVDYH